MTKLEVIAQAYVDLFRQEPARNTRTAGQFLPFIEAFLRMCNPIPWKVRIIILFTGRIPTDYLEGRE